MKKTIKKVLAAVLAATMIIGSMAVAAFAADTYNVAGAEGLCGVDWKPDQNQMKANGDGTYSCTFTGIKKGTYEFKVVTNGDWGKDYNLEGDASLGGSNAKVTVDNDNSTVVVSFDGTKASVKVNPAADNKAGDASHTALFVVLAVAATAAVVTVAAKKRTVTE